MANVSETVHFIVNAEPPRILILSPANKDYTTTDIPLDIQVNRPVSQVTYSLDGHNNTAIAGNATLTGLYYGLHYLTVHVVDAAGNMGDSERVTFRVTKPEPFPTIWIAAAAILVVVIGLGLLVYFKKRNH
jgi:hypothetical protein